MNQLNNIIFITLIVFLFINLLFLSIKILKRIRRNIVTSKKNIESAKTLINNYSSETEEKDLFHINSVKLKKMIINVEDAINGFSPLLEILKNNIGIPIFLYKYYNIPQFDNWIILANITTLENNSAVSTLSFKNDYFIFCIFLDKKYFEGHALNQSGIIAVTHEYCHFIAYLISSSNLPKEIFLKRIKSLFDKKLNSIYDDDFKKLSSPYDDKLLSDALLNFSDEHFRLGYENTQYSYSELFKGLLFPNAEFKELFNNEKQNEFENYMMSNKISEATQLFFNIISLLLSKTNLPKDFILEYSKEKLFGLLSNVNTRENSIT